MPAVGFEPTISASERPQTCALDRAATGIGNFPHLFQAISTKSPDPRTPLAHFTLCFLNFFRRYATCTEQFGFALKLLTFILKFCR